MDTIPIDHAGSFQDAIRAGLTELRAGKAVLIFPEGGRTHAGSDVGLARRDGRRCISFAVRACGRTTVGRVEPVLGDDLAQESLRPGAFLSRHPTDLRREQTRGGTAAPGSSP